MTGDLDTPMTRSSPRLAALAALSIHSPQISGTGLLGESSISERVADTSVVIRRRSTMTSDLGKLYNAVGRARKKLIVDEFGEKKVIHPVYLPSIKVNRNGMVDVSSISLFLAVSNIFVRHHAELNCSNYQKKSYRTQCNCLANLIEEENSDLKISQLSQSMVLFFTRTRTVQKLVLKEWLRSAMYSGVKYKRNQTRINFTLTGVYYDAAPVDSSEIKNQKPFKVCMNAMAMLFNQGYHKIKSLKDDLESAGVKEHGLKNKPCNRFVNKQMDRMDLHLALHSFFVLLKDEAETHATRVIREASGVQLRDEEIDTVELPSSLSKRQIYYKFCFQRGYIVKSDAKESMPRISDIPIREFDETLWPAGSVPMVVCGWYYFRQFWKTYYPKMTIRPPSHDTCAECWKYKNALGVTSRLRNDANRREHRDTMNSEIANLDVNNEDNNEDNNNNLQEQEEEELEFDADCEANYVSADGQVLHDRGEKTGAIEG